MRELKNGYSVNIRGSFNIDVQGIGYTEQEAIESVKDNLSLHLNDSDLSIDYTEASLEEEGLL